MSESFRYKAFISYSHADEKWARWLHMRLERFRPPKGLRVSGPLKPIFRDREELAASSDLSTSIQEALIAAESLIVICSPASAKSQWVDEEIREFSRLGRADRIFCLIVGGVPNDPVRECLPPTLRSDEGHEPLAADVRPGADGRRDAAQKIIAGLLGVGFDDLKQRSIQTRNRRLVVLAGTSLVGMVTMAALLVSAIISRGTAIKAQLAEEQQRVVAEEARREAEVQAATSERVANFMEDVFLSVDPAADGSQVTALELLDDSTARLKDEYRDDDPEVAARLLEVTADVYEVLGQYDSATQQQDLYLELSQAAYGPASYEAAAGIVKLAALTRRAGRFDEAVDFAKKALEIQLNDKSRQHRKDAEALAELGRAQSDSGLNTDAVQSYQRSLSLTEGDEDLTSVRIKTLNSFGAHLISYGSPAEARPILEENVRLRKQLFGAKSYETLVASNNLAAAYYALEEYDLAEPVFKFAVDYSRERFGADHPETATAMNNLANIYDAQGKYGQARELQKATLNAWQMTLGADHPDVGIAHYNLGNSYLRIADPGQALEQYGMAESVWKASLNEAHPYFVHLLVGYIRAHVMLDDEERAAEIYRDAISRSQVAFGSLDFVHSELEKELPDFYEGMVNSESRPIRDIR